MKGKLKTVLCTLLLVAILFSACPTSIIAQEEIIEERDHTSTALTSTETTTTTVEYGPAGIENGAVYAMQNVGTGLWASARRSTDGSGDGNVYQSSSWSSDYQTFTFEKTDTADNTYIIYTAETDTSGGKYALYCDYSTSAATNINIYPKVYNSSSAKSGYEWQIVQQDGYIHSIHLNADPNYKLYVRGTTAGSESNTEVTAVGNIIVRKSTSTSIADQQKWRLVYVLSEGEYYIKNRGTSNFLHGSNNDVVTRDFDESNFQKWRLDHYQNGQYQIYLSTAYSLVYLNGSQDGGDVSLSWNNMQPSSMWYIERLIDGTFKIESVWTDSLNVDYALKPASETNTAVKNGAYTADAERSDEWYVMSTSGKYGIQTFWDLDESLYASVNCHGYAMQMPEWPSDWYGSGVEYYNEYADDVLNAHQSGISYEQYQDGFQNAIEKDFELWASRLSGITCTKENDFTGNGEYKTLEYNQYRIILKTGFQVGTFYHEGVTYDIVVFDYHFWYQTYDGSWVNKHGQGEPQRIESGMTPFSEESEGWVLESCRWYVSTMGEVTVYFEPDFYFYNSDVCSYIITIE